MSDSDVPAVEDTDQVHWHSDTRESEHRWHTAGHHAPTWDQWPALLRSSDQWWRAELEKLDSRVLGVAASTSPIVILETWHSNSQHRQERTSETEQDINIHSLMMVDERWSVILWPIVLWVSRGKLSPVLRQHCTDCSNLSWTTRTWAAEVGHWSCCWGRLWCWCVLQWSWARIWLQQRMLSWEMRDHEERELRMETCHHPDEGL